MSKFTFVANAGRRIVVQPSKTTAGALQFELLGSDRQSLGVVSFDAENAGAFIAGIEAAAYSAGSVKFAAGNSFCICSRCADYEKQSGGQKTTHAQCQAAELEAG